MTILSVPSCPLPQWAPFESLFLLAAPLRRPGRNFSKVFGGFQTPLAFKTQSASWISSSRETFQYLNVNSENIRCSTVPSWYPVSDNGPTVSNWSWYLRRAISNALRAYKRNSCSNVKLKRVSWLDYTAISHVTLRHFDEVLWRMWSSVVVLTALSHWIYNGRFSVCFSANIH